MQINNCLKSGSLVAAFLLVGACSGDTAQATDEASFAMLPETRWDHRPEADDWTEATLVALSRHGAPMVEEVPADIDHFCPGYASAAEQDRRAFWTGLFSGLARYESGWRPEAAGAGGRYRGLLQIFPQTARYHGCQINGAGELYEGERNLSCAVRIATEAVTRDGVVAGVPGNWGGVAADWPPLRDASKRNEIAEFTRAQDYCAG